MRLPRWLLPVGIGVLLVSLAAYCFLLWRVPTASRMIDLQVYVGTGRRLLDRTPLYDSVIPVGRFGLAYTYPPFPAVVFAVLALVGLSAAKVISVVVTISALFASVWLAAGLAGFSAPASRVGLAAAITGVSIWLEPTHSHLVLGQVNIVLMLLVLLDLVQPDRSPVKGLAIGLAAGIKLVPGVFIIYLLLTRRFRAAALAAAAFVATVGLGVVVAPGDSVRFWTGTLFQTGRVGESGRAADQSVHGLVTRLLGDSPLWIVAVLVVGAGGLALAAWASHRGEELLAVVCVGLTSVLVSPVGWSHYWVWIAPAMVAIVAMLVGDNRVVMSVVLGGLVLLFAAYPVQLPREDLKPAGVIWAPYARGGIHDTDLSIVEKLMASTETLVTLVLLALAVAWLRRQDTSRTALP